MSSFSTAQIRNIALVGHTGSGKTTLTEALLAAAGRIQAAGSVEKGTTVSDFDPLEIEFQHTLKTTLLNLPWGECKINLIDTPGFPDFLGHSISVLPAVETAAVVVNAQNGIEGVTQRMFKRAGELGLCRLIIVNRIDAEHVNLPALLDELQQTFGKGCLPINLPANGGERVVDCFFNPSGEADFLGVAQAHSALIDQVVEVDEELMALYLEQGEELAPEQLHAPFEQALREGHLIPVCFVSARTGAGVAELLSVFEQLAPNPAEGNPPPLVKISGDKQESYIARPDPAAPVVAHAFKISIDPYVGKLAMLRVYQGTIQRDSQLYIGDARKAFKVGHLYTVNAKQHEEINAGIPGDICAIAKIDEIYRDAVLHDSHDEDSLQYTSLNLPKPVAGLAISARTRNDEQRLADVLHRLLEEDPCLRLEFNQSTRETVLHGLSELHLKITLDKMRLRYKLEVDSKPPRIAYRETITAPAEGHYRHKKQTGGAGQFAEVRLRIEPLPRGEGFQFASAVVGGAIPGVFIPAVEKGVREALINGAIAGYPIQDIKVVVTDGKHHPVDSKEIAFVTAGREAFLDAVRAAMPVILEPFVNLDIAVPDNAVGAVSSDITGRRGRIGGTETLGDERTSVTALAPQAELDDYSSILKAMTGGTGRCTIAFSHYDIAPSQVQQHLVEQYRSGALG